MRQCTCESPRDMDTDASRTWLLIPSAAAASVQIKASSIDLVNKFCHPAKKKEQLQFLVLREYILKRT